MKKYAVKNTVSSLRLRSTPSSADSSNIIGRIAGGSIVELHNDSNLDWWYVKVESTGKFGYVFADYLVDFEPEISPKSKNLLVHFPRDQKAQLNSKAALFKPLGDDSIEFRNMTNVNTKKDSIKKLINKLSVTKSRRYLRTDTNTFCNIYAYDFCYFSKVYLPRVWWYDKYINDAKNGNIPEIIWGKTVREMNANALHDWLINWGDQFDWIMMNDLDLLQKRVNNEGGIGIICAKRKDTSRSGHIVVVVPETETTKSYRVNGIVKYPLQSQAGSYNYEYFSSEKKAWWLGSQFSSNVICYHS